MNRVPIAANVRVRLIMGMVAWGRGRPRGVAAIAFFAV